MPGQGFEVSVGVYSPQKWTNISFRMFKAWNKKKMKDLEHYNCSNISGTKY